MRGTMIEPGSYEAPFPFDFEPAYRAEGSAGVAWRADGYEAETIHEWVFGGDEDDDRDDETLWYWDEDGYVRPTGMIVAHMVGDDRPHTFDPEDLKPISDDEFCSGCGQIGCGWGH